MSVHNETWLNQLKKSSEITIETLDYLQREARNWKYYKCNCECHNCNILNMRHHNSITIISQFQCLECPCPPIQFDANEFDILRLHLRVAWRKQKQTPYPIYLRNEKMLLDLLVKINLKEMKKIPLPTKGNSG